MAYPIVFSTNNNYLPFVSVAIQSIIENASSSKNYDIFIFYDELEQNEICKIKKMSTINIQISFIDVNKYLNFDKKFLKECSHYTKEMYYRFLIPHIFQQYDKVLYIDCDLVFNIDPQIYFSLDLEDNCLAAVNDIGVLNLKGKYNEYVLSLGVSPEKYFNSGVLVMNIKELVKIDLFQKFINIIQDNKTFIFPDQDILNIICKDRVYYLDYAYNYQWATYLDNLPFENFSNKNLYQQYLNASQKPYIVHYVGGHKPWKNPKLSLAEYFWEYARLTSFYECILLDCFILNSTKLFDVSLFDYYKYKIKSKIPGKKQALYKQKYKNIKTKLEKIKRINKEVL